MSTQSLLLCKDADTLAVLRETLGQLGIDAEVCEARETALDVVDRRRFDPIIVDCDQLDADGEVLRRVRASSTNKDVIALGIIRDDSQVREVYTSGANFVIRKPVTAEEAGRVLRAARALVMRMRRHFLRCALDTLAQVRIDGIDHRPMLLDIGEGGMSLQALEPLEPRRAFAVHFALPGESEDFEAVATAAWADPSGRCGLRFLGMPPVHRQRLKQWLDRNGASGPGENPVDISRPAGGRWVHLPVRISPALHLLSSILVDLVIVGVAVAIFVAIIGSTLGSFPEIDKTRAAVLLLCLGWLMYRYGFFGSLALTPGGHAAVSFCDRALAWHYNKTVVGRE